MNFLLHAHEGHEHVVEEAGHNHGSLVGSIEHFLLDHWGAFGEFLAEVVLHAIVETLGIILFLFFTYLLLEFIEHKAKDKTEKLMRRAGAFGPAIGGLLGVAPQCGFSTVAANLYTSGVVTLGTLIAVFLSTSDEMLMILLNHSDDIKISSILLILGYKVLAALIVGFIVDLVIRIIRKKRGIEPVKKHPLGCTCAEHRAEKEAKAQHRHGRDHHHGETEHTPDHDEHHEHDEHSHTEKGEGDCDSHDHVHGIASLLKCALGHTLSVGLFVFLITLALNALMHYVGADVMGKILVDVPVLSHLIAGVVGLIPNCAVSVALCELAINGLISEGVMLSGLFAGAGVGLLVLIRTNSDPWEDFYVPAILVAAGVVFGVIADLLPFINIF